MCRLGKVFMVCRSVLSGELPVSRRGAGWASFWHSVVQQAHGDGSCCGSPWQQRCTPHRDSPVLGVAVCPRRDPLRACCLSSAEPSALGLQTPSGPPRAAELWHQERGWPRCHQQGMPHSWG